MSHLLLVALCLSLGQPGAESSHRLSVLTAPPSTATPRSAAAEDMLLPAPQPMPAPAKPDCVDCPRPAPPPELPTPVVSLQVLAPANSGDQKEIEYRILLENRSPAAAYAVTVKNAVPKNANFVRSDPPATLVGNELKWELGTFEPGTRRAIVLVLAPTGPGTISNCARVSFEHGVCVETCTTAMGEKPVEPPPPTPAKPPIELKNGRISLNIKAPDRQAMGSDVVYQLTVANEGNIPITDAAVVARYPAGAVYVSGTGSPQHLGLEARQVRWALGTLDAGKSVTIELHLKPSLAGRLETQAEATGVTSTGPVRAMKQAVTEIIGQGALHVEVIDTLDPVLVGEETEYTILVRNQGTGPLTNIRVTALTPPELWVVRVKSAVQSRNEGQMVVFEPFNLPGKNETTFRVTAQAVKAGFVRYAVTLQADQFPKGIVREEEGTNVLEDPSAAQSLAPWKRSESAKPPIPAR